MIRPEYLKTLFIPKEPKENQPLPDWSSPFAILTAHNPGGKRHEDAINQHANEKLRTRLNQRRPRNSPLLVKVDAVSEDWSHTEKSFAVWGLNHKTASEIGREFRQDAFFWVENGTVHVHSCHTQEKQKVGTWEDRLRTSHDKPTRNLYVIQLDPLVRKDSKAFREKNPNYKADKHCLYVGSSAHTPEKRFAQHKAGIKSNRYAKKYGLKLLPGLYQNQPILTDNNYIEEEKAYAEVLRIQGNAVWQN
jgi:predicted GIY-YIG superfamily endonuclease